ncbi:MAG: tetratricopeptide repeat protein [Bacteroidales bacterium]|nr:tetratricopeptide repeat protein [Bacteroidales bacterium]
MEIPQSDLIRIREQYNQGRYRQAYALSEPFGPIRHWSGPAARLLGGRLAIQLGAPKLGRQLHLVAFRESPAFPEAIYYHARYRLERFGPLACWEFLRQHPDWSESSPELRADWLALWGYTLGRMRDFDRADQYFAEAEALCENRAWLNVERASIYEYAERYEDGLAAARQSLAIQPWFRPAVQAVGQLLHRQGKTTEAIDFLTEACTQIEAGIVVAQLAALQYETGRFTDARQSLDRYEELCPLLEPDLKTWLARSRGDVAYALSDFATAIQEARAVGEPFYETFAETLERERPTAPQQTRLAVDLTFTETPPGVYELLTRFWSAPPLPESDSADTPPSDGLPDGNARRRFQAAHWITREFTLTRDTAVALIARGVPFLITLVETGFSQPRLAFGTDTLRSSLWLADGLERHPTEGSLAILLERYAAFGPHALVAVPPTEAARLDDLSLPDAAEYDALFELQCRLADHQYPEAHETLQCMRDRFPTHCLTRFANLAWAKATGHPVLQMEAITALQVDFPHVSTLVMAKTTLLRELGLIPERLATLEAAAQDEEVNPLILQSLAQMLLMHPHRRSEANRLLRRSLQMRPTAAAGYYLLGSQYWDEQRFEEAVELYRFAACLEDHDEQFGEVYVRSARAIGKSTEAMKVLQARVSRPKLPAIASVKLLFTALQDRDEPEYAFAALQKAIEKYQAAHQAGQSSPPGSETPAHILAELLLFRADQYSNISQFEKAEADLAAAKPLADPAHWFKYAARVARTRPNYTQALEYIRALLEHDPLNAEAQRIVAGLIAETEGRTAARTHLRTLTQRYASIYPLLRMRAEFLYREPGEEAIAAAQVLVDLCPHDAWAWRQLAMVYADKKQHDAALAAIQKAEQLEPTHPSHFAVLAHVHRRADRTEEAVETLKAAIRLFPDHEMAIAELVQTSRGLKEKKFALRFVAETLHAAPFTGDGLVSYYEQSVRLIDDADEYEQFFAELERFLEERPDVWQCWSLVIQTMTNMQRAEEATALAEEATTRFPLSAKLWVDLAQANSAANRTEESLEALQKAATVAPGWPPLANELAEALATAEDDPAAIHVLERAVARNPLDSWIRWQLADRLWHADQGEAALEQAKASVRHEPGYEPDNPARPDMAWGAVQYWSDRLFRPDDAVDLARELTRDRAGDPRIWVRLARTLNDFSSADEILAALDRAIALDPRYVDAYDLKAERLAQLERYEEALAAARPAALLADLPLVLQGRAAWIEARRGNYDLAIPPMQALVAVDPDYVWGWQQLAEWYNETHRPQSYLEAAKELIRLRPEHPMSLTMRGEARLQLGDREAGKEDLREVLRTFPNYSPAAAILFDAYLADDEMKEARTALAVLQEHMAGPEGLIKQLQFAIKQNEIELAAQAFAEICQQSEEGSSVYLQMAFNQMRAADWEDRAVTLLRDAWQSGEEFNPWAAIYWLDTPAGETASTEDRLAAVEAVNRQSPRFLAGHDRRAEILAFAGRYDEALTACAPPEMGTPPPIALRGRAAWVEARRGHRALAIAQMKVLLAEEPDYHWGWRQLTHWYDADGRNEEMLAAADQLVRLSPGEPISHMLRGEARRALGDHRGACEDYAQAYQADPQFEVAGLQLIEEQLATDDVTGAASTLSQLQAHADGPLLKLRSVQVAARQGELSDARANFQKLGVDPAATRKLLRDAALAMIEAGWEAEVDDDLDTLVRAGTASPATAGLWVDRMIQSGHGNKAADRLGELVENNREAGREAVLVYVWGMVDLGQISSATATVQRYSELLREEDDSWALAGAALTAARHFALAAAWLGDWTEREDVSPEMLRPLHDAFRALARDEDADRLIYSVLLMEEDLPDEFYGWLALTLAVEGKPEEATEYLNLVERIGLPDGTKLIFALAAACIAIQKAAPAEKSAVFADARADLRAAVDACPQSELPLGVSRWYLRVVSCLVRETGTLTAMLWSLKQHFFPWIR